MTYSDVGVVTKKPRTYSGRVEYPTLVDPVNDWSFEGFVVLPPLAADREQKGHKRRMGVLVVGFRYADQPNPPYRLRIHVYEPLIDDVMALKVGTHVFCRGGFSNAYTAKGVYTNLIATSVEKVGEGGAPKLDASTLL